MSSIWNNRISVSIFGESHGPAIGVVIDNLPAGENVDVAELMKFLARRAPKKDGTTTNRNESDFRNIIRELEESSDENSQRIAEKMRNL